MSTDSNGKAQLTHGQKAFQAMGEPALSSEQYVDADGMACPSCGDTRFVKYSEGYAPELTGSWVTVRVECTECKATWVDEYALTGYTNFSAVN